ncbi:hypothetical protein THMIRHAS_23030 [Thiosulfatimonas sediminis]|uniref:Lipoprotein n=1 Tax=Thiosulfatimonas sediminis TaxID=2675054 RepID=A0A6F8PY90_9GAMM|nr:hypothetical protein [Thiosulfatimonas sediminis]BBP46930.1 hypothetical protein THMIRHAS_23030 [Thiosulfatimonas sediminis]
MMSAQPLNRFISYRVLWLCTAFSSLLLISGCDQTAQPNANLWPTAQDCNLHQGACSIEHQGAKVTLQINPQPIPIARPLGVQLTLENLNPSEVQLDISGINMYMGYNRISLTSTKPNHWVGTSMLAFCTAEKMQWQLTLMLTQNGEEIQIPFFLETSNRGQ